MIDLANYPATFHDLKGASVFISGGGSGIGAALTEGFLRQGANVAFVQRSDASDFCDSMKDATGTRPLFLQCDVADTASLKAAIAEASAKQGGIGILVNNAANDQRKGTLEIDEAFWQGALDVNLSHYFFASQAVIPAMQAAGKGAIVNFSSITYMMGAAGLPAYVAANAAIMGLTRSMAREFGPDHIRINAIAPGWVLTERQRKLWVTPEALEAHIARQCLPDEIDPVDMVGGALFLASAVSRMMTGQMMVIDGGLAVTG